MSKLLRTWDLSEVSQLVSDKTRIQIQPGPQTQFNCLYYALITLLPNKIQTHECIRRGFRRSASQLLFILISLHPLPCSQQTEQHAYPPLCLCTCCLLSPEYAFCLSSWPPFCGVFWLDGGPRAGSEGIHPRQNQRDRSESIALQGRGRQDSKGETTVCEAVVRRYSYRVEWGSVGMYGIFSFLVILRTVPGCSLWLFWSGLLNEPVCIHSVVTLCPFVLLQFPWLKPVA